MIDNYTQVVYNMSVNLTGVATRFESASADRF